VTDVVEKAEDVGLDYPMSAAARRKYLSALLNGVGH
jgi:hypothetical protein